MSSLKRTRVAREREVEEKKAPSMAKRAVATNSKRYKSNSYSKKEEDSKSYDDNEGFLFCLPGAFLTDRYKVLDYLGKGTFSRVYDCWDCVDQKFVAIKVIRNIPKYRDAAMVEINILQIIKANDPLDVFCCGRLICTMEHRNHICMVFDKYGLSLYDFLRNNRFRGFSMPHIRDIAKQLLLATKFLHDLAIIHTDIKIENIVLVDSSYMKLNIEPSALNPPNVVKIPNDLKIRVIDFGSAIFDSSFHPQLVSTRHYRAPEIVLGVKYSNAIDMWSIGCILFELYTGKLLFDTHVDDEHLKLMERVIGDLPSCFSRSSSHFRADGSLTWTERQATKESRERISTSLTLEAQIGPDEPDFLDLCRRLLEYDPLKRLTADQALLHPWLHAE